MLTSQDHKPDLADERKRIENEGGDVIEKAGIQRVVWKRPVSGPRRPVSSSSASEKVPFLAISRALGMLCYIQMMQCLIEVVVYFSHNKVL